MNEKPTKPTKPKWLWYALGIVGLGSVAGAGLWWWNRKQPASTPAFQPPETVDLPSSITNPTLTPTSTAGSGFPLKHGSKGDLVKQLQRGLINRYPNSKLAQYGDTGNFLNVTSDTLKSNGWPVIVDLTTFRDIINPSANTSSLPSGSSTGTGFYPKTIADKLYSAALSRDLDRVLTQLRKIKSVSDYSAVNTYFFTKGIYDKTIVSMLLSRFLREDQKVQIRAEFTRMGLKYDGNKWSLSGLDDTGQRIATTTSAEVWDNQGASAVFPSNTILGTAIGANNGITHFQAADGKHFQVKTNQIQYA